MVGGAAREAHRQHEDEKESELTVGLQGPFPATLEIKTEDEAVMLLAALSAQKQHYLDIGKPLHAKVFDELYARVVMACGDD